MSLLLYLPFYLLGFQPITPASFRVLDSPDYFLYAALYWPVFSLVSWACLGAVYERTKAGGSVNQPPTMPVIFIDVDDTLVRSAGGKRIPMTPVVERVRELHSRGFELYCWSSAGADYARTSVEELGIAARFVGFLPKPDVLIDDQHPNDWRQLRWLHPNEAASRGPDDYLAERER